MVQRAAAPASPMPYRKLGKSGMKVSALCFGSNMFGNYVDQAGTQRVLDAGMDNGINFIDTAESYSRGASETLIGHAIKAKRQHWIVGCKVWGPMGDGPNDRGVSRKRIIESAEASLKRLQTDYIDLLSIHHQDPDTPFEESLRALDDLVSQGKVRYVGISNHPAWLVMRGLWTSDKLGLNSFVCYQPQYNLLNRGIEQELLPMCREMGIAVTPYSVLNGGLLTGRYEKGEAAPEGSRFASRPEMMQRMFSDKMAKTAANLKAVSNKYERTVPDLLIGWALANPAITSVIVGASKPEQVAANAKGVERPLSPEIVKAVEEAAS